MGGTSEQMEKDVIAALTEDERVDTATATAAVQSARRAGGKHKDSLSLYRAAREALKEQQRPSDVRTLHESQPPVPTRRPPPRRRGTRRDTPAAKRER